MTHVELAPLSPAKHTPLNPKGLPLSYCAMGCVGLFLRYVEMSYLDKYRIEKHSLEHTFLTVISFFGVKKRNLFKIISLYNLSLALVVDILYCVDRDKLKQRPYLSILRFCDLETKYY